MIIAVSFPVFAAQCSVSIINIAGAQGLYTYGNISVFLVENFPCANRHLYIASVYIAAQDFHFNVLIIIGNPCLYLYGEISVIHKAELRTAPGYGCIKSDGQIKNSEVMAGAGRNFKVGVESAIIHH